MGTTRWMTAVLLLSTACGVDASAPDHPLAVGESVPEPASAVTRTSGNDMDPRGFVVAPTAHVRDTTVFRMTIPDGQVLDVALPGTLHEAIVSPSIGLLEGPQRMGGGFFRASGDGTTFVDGPCAAPHGACSLVRRIPLRGDAFFDELQIAGTDRRISIVVFGHWAIQADAGRAANFEFRTDERGFPVVRAANGGYATDDARMLLLTEGGAGRYQVTVAGTCPTDPAPLACVDGVALAGGPPGHIGQPRISKV